MQHPLQHLSLFTQSQLSHYTTMRAGEQKLGQKVGVVNTAENIATATQQGYRFALIGIPESIGPVANHGYAGAEKGWDAFLTYFLNLQSNDFLSGDNVLLLGHVNCDDLMRSALSDTSHTHQQQLCEQLDQRVHHILLSIFNAGLIPIVIGGGHNNAYPIIKACAESKQQSMAVTNLDPHADFRALEGRHSGNPFHYAHNQGHLERYSVLGLHEQKNSADALNALKKLQFPFYSMQQIFWRKEITFDKCIAKTQDYLTGASSPIGIEVDVDAITEMPSSATTRAGISLDDALFYVHQIATLPKVQYLHLAEGAPSRHPAGEQAGKRVVGQTLAELSCAFIKGGAKHHE